MNFLNNDFADRDWTNCKFGIAPQSRPRVHQYKEKQGYNRVYFKYTFHLSLVKKDKQNIYINALRFPVL